MPVSARLSAPSPSDALRACVDSVTPAYWRELADLAAAAGPNRWLHPHDSGRDAAGLPGRLWATESGRPLAGNRVLPELPGTGQGRVTLASPPPLPKQPAWWCRSCGSCELLASGWCRRCYDRRRHSERYFGGHREQVPTRDDCCPLCLTQTRLAVHRCRPGCHRPALPIPVCVRCPVRMHRRQQLPGVYCDLFFRLWREVHPATSAQLRLPLAA